MRDQIGDISDTVGLRSCLAKVEREKGENARFPFDLVLSR